MIQRTLASNAHFNACLFALYFMVAAASFSGFYNKWHFGEPDVAGEDYRFQFDRMVDGTAYRPYVYRQMLPTLADWIDGATPLSLKTWLYNAQAQPDADATPDTAARTAAHIDPLFDSATAESPVYFFRYLLVYIATFLFALIAIFAMRQVCVAAKIPDPAATLAPAVLVLLVPFLESEGGFFYDYSELAFFAIAVWMALRFKWGWLLPVVALATWNKESFLLFVPALYPFVRSRAPRASALSAMGALSAVCVGVYLPLRARFAANPGGGVELHWRDQLHYLLHLAGPLFEIEKTYGLPLPKVFSLMLVALCVWTAVRVWRHLPRATQSHAKIAAAINIPLYALFCWPGEWRNFSMLYVALLLVLAYGCTGWLKSGRPV